MDLSFARFERHHELVQLPGDLAVLMVGVAARQAASPTAAMQAQAGGDSRPFAPDPRLLQPVDGAFNGPMAAAIQQWSEP